MDPSQPANQLTNAMDGMDEVIKEFLVESNEGLDRFDHDLIALEKDKTSRELLDSIFRAVHTIKGTGGVLGYDKLVSISHLGESVLSRMRDGVLLLSPPIATALLAQRTGRRQRLFPGPAAAVRCAQGGPANGGQSDRRGGQCSPG